MISRYKMRKWITKRPVTRCLIAVSNDEVSNKNRESAIKECPITIGSRYISNVNILA